MNIKVNQKKNIDKFSSYLNEDTQSHLQSPIITECSVRHIRLTEESWGFDLTKFSEKDSGLWQVNNYGRPESETYNNPDNGDRAYLSNDGLFETPDSVVRPTRFDFERSPGKATKH